MRITFLFSALESAIIAVIGDKLEAGATATAFDGTATAGVLSEGAAPIAIIEDVIKQFRAEPDSVPLYFLLHGGIVNDKDNKHYKVMTSVDLWDDAEASPDYVGE